MIEWWMIITGFVVAALFFFTSVFSMDYSSIGGLAISFFSFWLAVILTAIKLIN
ncbi:MAG: hypothetical protein ABFS03_00810 [Chloroflexota bacterium]